jgi:predicted YcjX-like family ATPase
VQGEEWGRSKEEREKANKQALQHLHQQGGQYLFKKKKNDKVVSIKVNKQANNGVKRFLMPKEIIPNMKRTKKVWIPKGK